MAFATTDDGQQIFYEVHGQAGPTLVLVSGYMGIANIWQPLISRLGDSYRCIAYDSRGYGRSSKPESPSAYSVPRHAADLNSVLKAVGVDGSFTTVTHSMGGNIASAYYLNHPSSSSSSSSNVSGIMYTTTYFDGEFIGKTLSYEDLIRGADQPEKCVEFYTTMGLQHDIAIEAAKWPAYGRRNNAKALVDFRIGNGYTKIPVPTLVIHGGDDAASPADMCVEPMEKVLPSCRVEVLKGVNHFPPTEAPEKLKELVDGFVMAHY